MEIGRAVCGLVGRPGNVGVKPVIGNELVAVLLSWWLREIQLAIVFPVSPSVVITPAGGECHVLIFVAVVKLVAGSSRGKAHRGSLLLFRIRRGLWKLCPGDGWQRADAQACEEKGLGEDERKDSSGKGDCHTVVL